MRNLVKQISSPDQNTTAIKRIISKDQRRLFGINRNGNVKLVRLSNRIINNSSKFSICSNLLRIIQIMQLKQQKCTIKPLLNAKRCLHVKSHICLSFKTKHSFIKRHCYTARNVINPLTSCNIDQQ